MENKYFKVAGDLEASNNNDFIQESFIKEYLLEITNETIELENVNIIASGSMIISFKDLQKMIEEGCYVFTKIEYLNPDMIIVEFQKYEKENKNSRIF